MDRVILDLEWNGTYSRHLKGYINEIIEFGAVKCDENLQVLDSFTCLVKPQVGKKLSAITSDLTSITDENLTDGVPFMRAVSQFRKWAGNAVVMTWGTTDILTLIDNCRYFSGVDTIPFLKYYCDIQLYSEHILKLTTNEQVGLSRAAGMVGVDVESLQLHRASEDSFLALSVLKKLYDPELIQKYIFVCDDEFYRMMTFKVSYVCDIRHPEIKRQDLQFACPNCGKLSRKITRWSMKNKGFRAEFKCTYCGARFTGRVIIKQRYEGITVNKKILPLEIIEEARAAKPDQINDMTLSIEQNGVGLLKFSDWAVHEGIQHAFSTRVGGVSTQEFATMNLGLTRGDLESNVVENYKRVTNALCVGTEALVCGSQDHHVNIRRVDKTHAGIGIWKPQDMESVDGLCTDAKGLTLVIYTADCVPIYFYDPEHHAIGLAHAGWKGTAAGMAEVMVATMQEEYKSRPEALFCAIGPSISRDYFEVDFPVAEVFLKLDNAGLFVSDPVGDKYHVDLWECNRQFLLKCGVKSENITVGGVCTMTHSDLLFSHRKTQGKRGCNAALLCLA